MQEVIKPFIEKHDIVERTIAVGVSGGADSLALVLLLKKELPTYRIIALTVDHQLRPTSYDEALYVAEVMKKFDIEHHILTWLGEKPTTGIEEQARIARYNLLCDWCNNNNVKYMAIAHHIFDQAETFFMRIKRESGLFGLSCMNEISQRNGINILRPLLNTHPEDLKNFLLSQNIKWVEDESNKNMDFLRVKMRNFLPLVEDYSTVTLDNIASTINNLQRTKSFIDDIVSKTIEEKIHKWGNSGYSLDMSEFISWHDQLKFYVIGQLVQNLTNSIYIPNASAILKLIDSIKQKDFNGATLGDVYFCNYNFKFWLIKENRNCDCAYSNEDWKNLVKNEPSLRGIEIPFLLKKAIICEKNQKK